MTLYSVQARGVWRLSKGAERAARNSHTQNATQTISCHAVTEEEIRRSNVFNTTYPGPHPLHASSSLSPYLQPSERSVASTCVACKASVSLFWICSGVTTDMAWWALSPCVWRGGGGGKIREEIYWRLGWVAVGGEVDRGGRSKG